MTDSEPGHEVARSELRASHEDRDRVVELLRVSAGDGRLTADELDERLELALTARTYGELARLVADLPATGSAVSAPAPRAKEVMRIDCTSGHTVKNGRWVVPQRIEARIRSGQLKLDFTQAVINQPSLQIDAEVNSGHIILITKPGIVVDTDDVAVLDKVLDLGVYAGLTALTPLAAALVRRFGAGAALVPFSAVAVVDPLRFGLGGLSWAGWINVAAGWMVPYLLGIAWARGAFRGRKVPALMLAGGVAGTAALVLWAGYPASMIGVNGAKISNLNPPTLAVVTFGIAQVGLALLLREALARWMRRPVAWAAVATANLSAMTLFLWHQTAFLTVTMGGLLIGRLPGLHTAPISAVWVAERLAWLPAFAAALAVLWLVFRGAGKNRAVSTVTASSFLNAAGRLAGDDQRADRGGPAGAAGAGAGLPRRVAAGPGRVGTDVGASLGPRRGDLDPHPGHGDRAVTLPGAPDRGRCRPRRRDRGAR